MWVKMGWGVVRSFNVDKVFSVFVFLKLEVWSFEFFLYIFGRSMPISTHNRTILFRIYMKKVSSLLCLADPGEARGCSTNTSVTN